MGSEAKTYEGIKVLILASYPAISGISQNKIQGIEKNIGSINNVKTHWKYMLIFISCIIFPFYHNFNGNDKPNYDYLNWKLY